MSVQDLERYLEEPISVLKRFLDQLPKDGQNKICNEALLPVLNSFINQKLGFIRLPDCACNSHPTAFKRNFLDTANHRNGESVDITKILSPSSNLESDSDLRFNFLINTQSDRAHDLLVQLLQRLSSEHKREVALPLIKVALKYYKEKHLSPNDSSSEIDAAAAAQSKSQQQPHSIGKLTTQIESYQTNGTRNENEWKHSSIEHISPIRNSFSRSSNQHQSSVNDSFIHENRETNLPVRSGISDSDRRDESSNGGMPGGGKKTFQKLIEQHLISKRNLPAQQPVLPSSSTDGISGVSSSSKSIQDYRAPALPEARDAKINDHYSRNSMAHSSFKLSESPKSVLSGGGGSLASSNAQKIDESLRSSQATTATSESRTPSESASQTSVPIHDSQQQQQQQQQPQQPQQRQPPQRASNGHLSMVEAFKNRNSMMMADRNKNSLDGDNNYQNYNPNKQNNNRNNRYDSNSSNQSQQPGDHRNATWQSKPKIGSEHQAPESPPFDRSAIPDDFDWTS